MPRILILNNLKSTIIMVLLLLMTVQVSAKNSQAIEDRDDVKAFIKEMVLKDGFKENELKVYFSKIKFRQDIIDLMSRPAEKTIPWYKYKKIFLTEKRIKQGVKFWHENKGALEYAKEVYGVPEEIIVAIIGVETFYGRITGKHRVIDALFTLAFEYPKRAKFFRSELKHFFRLCKEQKIDPLTLKGSYAGAMGLGQFMPSSYRAYAVNFDGKDSIDIWENKVDAIGSVANYFKRHGWKNNGEVISKVLASSNYQFDRKRTTRNKLKPKKTLAKFSEQGIKTKLSSKFPELKAALIALEKQDGFHYWLGLNNFYTITRYNHSPMYAMAVYLLSQEIKNNNN